MHETKSLLDMVAWRFIRGAIAGAVASMTLINASGINSFENLETFATTLMVSGIVGGITGGLLAVDKAIRGE